jgi:hypothetical protein
VHLCKGGCQHNLMRGTMTGNMDSFIVGLPICIDISGEEEPFQQNQIAIEIPDLEAAVWALSERG